MLEIVEQAKQKLAHETENFKGGQKEKVIYKEVAKTLFIFCETEEFARAVCNSEKTLSDCCTEILKNISGGISDFEAYKRAAQFYFPKATVRFNIEIQLENQEQEESKPGKIISLLDLI